MNKKGKFTALLLAAVTAFGTAPVYTAYAEAPGAEVSTQAADGIADKSMVIKSWGEINSGIDNAFDGDPETVWQTKRKKGNPYVSGVLLSAGEGKRFSLTGVSVTSSNEECTVMVYGTNDSAVEDVDFGSADEDLSKSENMAGIAGLTLITSGTAAEVSAAVLSAEYKYIVIVPDTTTWDPAQVDIYEIALSGSIADATEEDEPAADGFEQIDRTDWAVTANSVRSGLPPENVKDGSADTYWSTDWAVAGFDKDENPYYITVDLGEQTGITRVEYTPRKFADGDVNAGEINGVLTEYELYGSNDDKEYTLIVSGSTGFNTTDLKYGSVTMTFPEVNYRYLRLAAKGCLHRIDQEWGYQFCCAEFKAYSGGDDLTAAAKTELETVLGRLEELETEEVKELYTARANELLASETVTAEEIERFAGTAEYVITCAEYAENGGADAVWFGRLIENALANGLSDESMQLLTREMEAFGTTGAEVYDYQKKMFGNAFHEMTEEQKGMTLYERMNDAVAKAEAYLASKDDPSEYIMLNELIGYLSDSDAYGMNAEKCEYVVNDIYFALANLEKIDAGELDTTLDEVRSGELWLDDKGSKISAHGGLIITGADGKYYWYGEDNKFGYWLTTGLSCYSSTDLKDWTYEGIVLSVRDNKTEQGRLFADDFLTDTILGTQGRLERPKVVYNEKTGKYVMWAHMENNDSYTLSAAGVAVADSPTGPFEWQWYGFPVWDTTVNTTVSRGNMKQTYRDCTLFVDTDGTGYTIYSSESNDTTYAVRLNDEYTWIDTGDDVLATDITYTDGLYTDGTYNYVDTTDEENIASGVHNYELPSFTAAQLYYTELDTGENGEYKAGIVHEDGKWSRIIVRETGQAREAPAVIYTGDNDGTDYNYQIITSGTSGWNSNPCYVYTADSILGATTPQDWVVCDEDDIPTDMSGDRGETYCSQSTWILKLPESANYDYVYMGDRWGGNTDWFGEVPDVNNAVKASNYVWLPLKFGKTPGGYGKEGALYANWSDSWDIGDAEITPPSTEDPVTTPEPMDAEIVSVTIDDEERSGVLPESGELTAVNIVKQADAELADCKLYAALYRDGQLAEIRAVPLDGNDDTNITVPSMDVSAGDELKVFIWNGDMKPAAKIFTAVNGTPQQ